MVFSVVLIVFGWYKCLLFSQVLSRVWLLVKMYYIFLETRYHRSPCMSSVSMISTIWSGPQVKKYPVFPFLPFIWWNKIRVYKMIRFYTSASKCGSACQNLKFTPSLHIIKCRKLVIFHRYSSYSYVTRGNAIIDGKGLLLVTCYFFPIRTGPVHRACTENVNSFSVCLFLPIGLLQTVIYFQSNKPYL